MTSSKKFLVCLAAGVVACGRIGFDATAEDSLVLPSQTVATQAPPDQAGGSGGGCAPGYRGTPPCVDIDECAELSPCASEAACENLPGTFSCTCAAGFAGDGFECRDIDDCATAVCDPMASCIDGVGTFACVCDAPFVGDGSSCSTCGNGTCEDTEGCETCPEDCGTCRSDCAGGACAVTSFTVIDPISLSERGAVAEGQVFDLDGGFSLGIGLRFEVQPAVVGSVAFYVDDRQVVTESEPPYGVSSNQGDVDGFSFLIPLPVMPGSYLLRATPFGGAEGTGESGRSLERNVTVVGRFATSLGFEAFPSFGRRDGEENGGVLNLDGTAVNLGADYTAFRFGPVVMDTSVTVEFAELQFFASGAGDDGPCSVRIEMPVDNSRLREGDRISVRATRGPFVDWDIPEFVAGEAYRSVDVRDLVQEYLDSLPGESEMQPLMFVTSRVSGACNRPVISVEGGGDTAARLIMDVVAN